MDYHKKALDAFVKMNEGALQEEFTEHCFVAGNGFANIHDGEIHNWDAFNDFVYDTNQKEIDEIEDTLKQEAINAEKESIEYQKQVESDYKLAQTGKY